MTWEGPWVAVLKDGPCKDSERWWAVGPVWKEIVLAPSPHDQRRWFLAGGDGIAAAPKGTEPWPDEAVYRLAHTKRAQRDGEDTMIAEYRVARS
jgi:hypothetical protein